ncbi:radical SAM protein [Thermocrinis minervae]|uniref:23S rRNA (Adenine2503-C2)-methyltransferase n=1 Tax=Thermocrinis minervae TaxID=381751 RepID=A0A1M6R4L9_9AQUI|nr:radical SAM protein [Thermocrinis minervae]SHK27419.1 23S rRNA (adenine2503-C2)-methyltransferase [Thermocrinis minervae]
MKLLSERKSPLNRVFVYQLEDGYRVESVFYRGDTLCVSTQVGCAVGCPFCLSGKDGLLRNLSSREIYLQYALLKDALPIRRIAIAGIGEPLMNIRNVVEAFWMFKKEGLKVSFYTSGHPVRHLPYVLTLPHSGLTVSLHAVRDEVRRRLLPHAGSLSELLKALRDSLSSVSKKKRKKVSLGYLLLKGVNDSEEDLTELARLAKSLDVSVTLLYYNNTVSAFEETGQEEYERAFLLLRSMGVRVTLSTRFRKDPLGGCGTLVVNRTL